MTDMKSIKEHKEHMEVIGADGVHLGTIDRVEDHRIKLTKADSVQGQHKGTTTTSTAASWPTWKEIRFVSRRTATSP
jgi:hypothetical protein